MKKIILLFTIPIILYCSEENSSNIIKIDTSCDNNSSKKIVDTCVQDSSVNYFDIDNFIDR